MPLGLLVKGHATTKQAGQTNAEQHGRKFDSAEHVVSVSGRRMSAANGEYRHCDAKRYGVGDDSGVSNFSQEGKSRTCQASAVSVFGICGRPSGTWVAPHSGVHRLCQLEFVGGLCGRRWRRLVSNVSFVELVRINPGDGVLDVPNRPKLDVHHL